MKIEQRTNDDERLILTGMILSDHVCGKITTKWKNELFKSKWGNLVGNWCSKYFHRYEKAPKEKIEHMFYKWSEKSRDTKTIELVEIFLEQLSEDYGYIGDELNTEYIIDTASKYFSLVQIDKLKDDLESDIDQSDSNKAIRRILEFNQINLGMGGWIDPFTDEAEIRASFQDIHKPLIRYRGSLGTFFGDRLERDGLIAFEAPEKRGKTWWLLDIVYRAIIQHRTVAYFQAGDLSKKQTLRRIHTRVAKRPIIAKTVEIPQTLKVLRGPEGFPISKVTTKQKTWTRPVNEEYMLNVYKKFCKSKTRNKQLLRLSVHSMDTLSVNDIITTAREWEYDGWQPDVFVIDYADILDMNYPGKDGRDAINQTWKDLRKLSQEFHCLVVTATQANALAYEATTLGRHHFSEDKRKHAHTTGFVGLNQTEIEKRKGVFRLNWIVLREAEFVTSKCVHIAGCLSVANPAILSSW